MKERSDYRSAKRQRVSETGTAVTGTNQSPSGANTVISNDCFYFEVFIINFLNNKTVIYKVRKGNNVIKLRNIVKVTMVKLLFLCKYSIGKIIR